MITWPDHDYDTYRAKLIASQSEELAFQGRGSFGDWGGEPTQDELEIECIGIADPRYKEGDIVMTEYLHG